ncbi:MAG TPA: hypothetical protein VFT41_12860 [Gemmatimonadaceae bacterium]|nr:hypothetical protein [Gemmatimonadaceae bacterium]
MPADHEPLTFDLGAAARLVAMRWRRVAAGVVFGLLVSAAVLLFWRPSFDGRALLLIREFPGTTGSLPSKSSIVSQLVPGLLGDQGDEELATELALLQSRAAIGAVVDSLRLEVQPREPGRTPPALLIDSLKLPDRFRPVKLTLKAGANVLPQGIVYASKTGAGAYVKLVDREDAISDLADRLSVEKAGGDAVEIRYSGRDSTTAAQVPNLLAHVYMTRRMTVDRGLNQRRLEFLTARADTVRHDLRHGVDSLAHLQTASGAGVDATIAARGLADQYATVQGQLAQLSASQHALDSLVAMVAARRADPRALAGFPDLLRSAAINDLVSAIAQVETQRTVLLGRVAPGAPQVAALQRARDSLTAQLLPMAEAYRQALARQRASLQATADSLETQLAALPAREAGVVKQEADVKQLSELDAGMGAQVLQARLAAMLEGGDVRLVDTAAVPRRVSFPRPLPTWLVGLFAGLLLGLLLVPLGGVPSES